MELWLQAIFLGIVQGLTEYLPISSTGHVRISAAFLGIPDPGAAFSAVTQVGTALAVAIYFRIELTQIIRVLVGKSKSQAERDLFKHMVIATIPIVIVGIAFADFFRNGARDLRLIAVVLILFGLMLFLADRFASARRDTGDLRMKDALLIGVSQTLALIPGVSRSGATITMARILGLNRVAAARVSFLLSMPAILLAAIFELRQVGVDSVFSWPHTLVASLVAFIFGYLTIEFMLRWLTNHTFNVFVVYRVLLGALVLILVAFFGLDPIE